MHKLRYRNEKQGFFSNFLPLRVCKHVEEGWSAEQTP
jgi:hypothetical protein